MDKQFLRYLQISYQILDLFILNVIVLLSKLILSNGIANNNVPSYYNYLIFLNVSWIALSWLSTVYGLNSISSFEEFTKKTKNLYIIWLCVVMGYLFFYRKIELSRFFIIASTIIFGLGLLLNRFLYIAIQNFSKKREQIAKRILVVGFNDTGKNLIKRLENGTFNKIVGLIEDREKITELTPYPVIGNIGQTISLSEMLGINQIYSTVSPEQNKDVYRLMQEAEARFIRFRIIPDLSAFVNRPVHFEYFEGMPMLSLRSEPLEDIGNRIKKRVVDVATSAFVVVFILSWLVPMLGLLIYLQSPGPIFFSQLRSGRNNKPFRCLKFRSMKMNQESDQKQATKDDDRITPIGRFIRKTSLDEFPQFWNVLIGEMSLVGPRPHMLKHTEEYANMVDQYMIRQFLKPGITGWAQVNGFRGEVKGHEEIQGRVDCDLWYSQSWTFWLDMRIIFLTVYNIFRGEENAY